MKTICVLGISILKKFSAYENISCPRLSLYRNQNSTQTKETTTEPKHNNPHFFQHFSHLKASHNKVNKVIITCIVKHTSQFALSCETSKTNLIYCVIMMLYFTFSHFLFIFLKGDFSGPGKELFCFSGKWVRETKLSKMLKQQ